jgi:hypothetical protein
MAFVENTTAQNSSDGEGIFTKTWLQILFYGSFGGIACVVLGLIAKGVEWLF